jgi:hypothetical protein
MAALADLPSEVLQIIIENLADHPKSWVWLHLTNKLFGPLVLLSSSSGSLCYHTLNIWRILRHSCTASELARLIRMVGYGHDWRHFEDFEPYNTEYSRFEAFTWKIKHYTLIDCQPWEPIETADGSPMSTATRHDISHIPASLQSLCNDEEDVFLDRTHRRWDSNFRPYVKLVLMALSLANATAIDSVITVNLELKDLI